MPVMQVVLAGERWLLGMCEDEFRLEKGPGWFGEFGWIDPW